MEKMKTLENEMELNGVLILATPSFLLAIDPAGLSVNPKVDMPDLPVHRALNLVKNGYPYGMRFFVRESKLYMVGGEKLLTDVSMGRSHPVMLDMNFGTKGASPYIYVSDLTSADSIIDLHKRPITMRAPKPNPFIVEVEGKIYVLYGTPEFYPMNELLFPTFEVYDPREDKWENLPDPPYYNPKTRTYDPSLIIYGIYAWRTTIYVRTEEDDYAYDVRTKEWKCLGSYFPLPPLSQAMPYEFQPGEFVPDYDDVFIGLHGGILFAASIPRDDSPPIYQFLDEVFDEYYKHSVASISGAVIAMGGKQMCVVKGGILETCRAAVYIATFLVEKLYSSFDSPQLAVTTAQGSSSPTPKRVKITAASEPVQDSDHLSPVNQPEMAEFVSVTCLTKGFYKLDARGAASPTIHGAFFQSWSS